MNFPARSTVKIVNTPPRRVQRLQHLPIARARVRLPEIARDRGENQQNPVAQAQESVALPSVDQRQDDKALEGVRARQVRRGLQHQGGERADSRARLHHIPPRAINQADGSDGRGDTATSLCQRSHLSHQLNFGQFWSGDLPLGRWLTNQFVELGNHQSVVQHRRH